MATTEEFCINLLVSEWRCLLIFQELADAQFSLKTSVWFLYHMICRHFFLRVQFMSMLWSFQRLRQLYYLH
jgi:hypothetical protein